MKVMDAWPRIVLTTTILLGACTTENQNPRSEIAMTPKPALTTMNPEIPTQNEVIFPPTIEVVVIPEFLVSFDQAGGEVDMDKGMAWNPENGRVMWLRARDGSWTEMKNGEALFNLTNGETLTFPIFDDIESALEYSVFEVGMAWGDMLAWSQNSYTAVDQEFVRKAQMIQNKVDQDTDVSGTVRLSQSDAPQKIAETKVSELILDDGTRVSLFSFRSSSDHNLHYNMIVDSSQNVLNALRNGTVYVPSPK